MSLKRLTIGERTATVSAILLFLSLFLDWFGISVPKSLGVDFFADGASQSAWSALDYIPIALTIITGVTLIFAAMHVAGLGPKAPHSSNQVVAGLGAASVLLILFRIINPPSVGSFRGAFGAAAAAESNVRFGIFVGLVAAAGIAVGGCVAMKEEGGSPPIGVTDRSRCKETPQSRKRG